MVKNNRLLPVDKVLIIYTLFTGLILIIGSVKELNNPLPHFLARIVVITFILFISQIKNEKVTSNLFFKLVRYFYPLALLASIYKETGYLNNVFFDFFDPFFADLEFKIFHFQPSLVFSHSFSWQWFSELMYMGYFSFYLIVFGLVFLVYLKNEKDGIKVMALIMISFFTYYLVFIFLPVKGPQFYFSPEELNLSGQGFFYGLVRLAQEVGETQTGAFPSSHVGVSFISLVLSYRYAHKVFPLILFLCMFLWPATVYIQAHYLIDVIAGFITAPFVLEFSYFVERKLSA